MKKWMFLAAALLPASAANSQETVDHGMLGVKIGVSDFARTSAFYTALGMHEGVKYNDHETSLVWNSESRSPWVVMVRDDSGRFPKGGTFMVFNVSDMSAVLARLERAGFTIPTAPQRNPRYTVLMLKDPDGNQIELLSGLGG